MGSHFPARCPRLPAFLARCGYCPAPKRASAKWRFLRNTRLRGSDSGGCDSPPNNEESLLSRIENHIVIGMADEDPLEEHSWQQTVLVPGRHVLCNAHCYPGPNRNGLPSTSNVPIYCSLA
jgi:hypothetical protein